MCFQVQAAKMKSLMIGNFAGDWVGAVSNCTMGLNFDSLSCNARAPY